MAIFISCAVVNKANYWSSERSTAFELFDEVWIVSGVHRRAGATNCLTIARDANIAQIDPKQSRPQLKSLRNHGEREWCDIRPLYRPMISADRLRRFHDGPRVKKWPLGR